MINIIEKLKLIFLIFSIYIYKFQSITHYSFYLKFRPFSSLSNKMAASKSLIFIPLLLLLFFFQSLPTSAAVCDGASNSLTGILRRNILQTAARRIADNNVERKMSVHIKRGTRGGRSSSTGSSPIPTRPVWIGTGRRTSAANRSRVASFGVGFLLIFSGLFMWNLIDSFL